jgi:RNA polymerase sigma-70 factor (sigma-E family)
MIEWPTTGRARQEFEAFVAGSGDELLRTAYLIAWDLTEAEDLVQETLLRVARRWRRVRSMEHPIAYARRILVNLALDGGKRRSRRRIELGGEQPIEPADETSGRVIAGVALRSDLMTALAALPPRQRAVLVLRYFVDLRESDVAEALGCSLGTVKSTASRGLVRLAQELGGADRDPSVVPDTNRSNR